VLRSKKSLDRQRFFLVVDVVVVRRGRGDIRVVVDPDERLGEFAIGEDGDLLLPGESKRKKTGREERGGGQIA